MAQKGPSTTLLVLALVAPLGGVTFIMNMLNLATEPLLTNYASDAVMQIMMPLYAFYLPLLMIAIAFAFSIVTLAATKKDKALPVVALALNSIALLSGLISVLVYYFQ